MFVEDIKSPEINVAADVSEKEVANFKEMCKMFLSTSLYERAIDEYLLKLQQIRPSCAIDLGIDVNSDEPPPAKRAALEHTNDIHSNSSSAAQSSLTNVIMANVNLVSQEIPNTAADLTFRNARRITNELNIFVQCTTIAASLKYLCKHYSMTLKLMPFGSSTYGFGHPNTDFNILIKTGKNGLTSLKFTVTLQSDPESFHLLWILNWECSSFNLASSLKNSLAIAINVDVKAKTHWVF